MNRRALENIVIVVVTGVWGTMHLVALFASPDRLVPSVDYIMGGIVGSMFAVKAWRKANGSP